MISHLIADANQLRGARLILFYSFIYILYSSSFWGGGSCAPGARIVGLERSKMERSTKSRSSQIAFCKKKNVWRFGDDVLPILQGWASQKSTHFPKYSASQQSEVMQCNQNKIVPELSHASALSYILKSQRLFHLPLHTFSGQI